MQYRIEHVKGWKNPAIIRVKDGVIIGHIYVGHEDELKAEKNEMRDVITKLLQVVEFYEPVDRHRELIRRAKTTIGREEE